MEETSKCRSLTAVYKLEKGVLGGPHTSRFTITKNTPITINIEQLLIRTITITSEIDVDCSDLYSILINLEKLLMLFDGEFYSLDSLCFDDSTNADSNTLQTISVHCINHRLSYYQSDDYCRYSFHKLINFSDIITPELYLKWETIIEELDMVHQTFLYTICNSKQPIDLKCAFLIELSEALVEIAKEHTNYFTELKPRPKGTSLKDCISALIKQYGGIIFKAELNGKYDEILQAMVNSRVRIMHIKRKQKGKYFNSEESLLYIIKMHFLYRHIIFSLLDINASLYEDKLNSCIEKWNNLNDVFLKLNSRL